ncbi:MAG: hypothetical protein LBC89_01675 [Bacteroidales bacterium]|jgi:uncharacterized pyridoxamine 5'-phosphate oxidase family protein|nr:hypothetical protein [Bacteroidales bacterium]
MTDDLENITLDIEHKSRQLVKNLYIQKNKITSLEKQNKDYQQIIENQKTTIQKLEKQISILSISGSLVTQDDKHLVKLNINRMIREIDECIQKLDK